MNIKKIFISAFFVMLMSVSAKAQNFEQTSNFFRGIENGNIIWGDFNNNGLLDIFIVGRAWEPIAEIHRNNGDGTFTKLTNSYVIPLSAASAAWVDVNNDGFLDLVVSGYYQLLNRPVTRVYINNNGESFSMATNNITGVYYGNIATGDYDNDGKIDLMVTGIDRDYDVIAKLYKNLGNGQFQEIINTPFQGVWFSSAAWGDFNGNGRLDVLITGNDNVDNNFSKSTTRLYVNLGNDQFQLVQQQFKNVERGSVSWGDYNGDGKLDILLTGQIRNGNLGIEEPYTGIYRNMGGGSFMEDTLIGLQKVRTSTAIWADVNNNGAMDIFISGNPSPYGSNGVSKLYLNDGSGNFAASNDDFKQLSGSYAAFGDYNNNGKLDLILTGYNIDSLAYVTFLYKNITDSTNTAPTVPGNMSELINESNVTLSWDPALDAQTNQESLTYNIRIGTTPGGIDVVSSMSHNDGIRMLPLHGNTNHNTSWTITGLAPGQYFWSVQTIDNGYMASEFSQDRSFEVEFTSNISLNEIATRFELKNNFPNPFNPVTNIVYSIPENGLVILTVYDILGKEVATLVNERLTAGQYQIQFDASNLNSGVYFYTLQSGSFKDTKRMILIK